MGGLLLGVDAAAAGGGHVAQSTYSIAMNGSSQYVHGSGPTFGSGDFSLSLWVKPAAFSAEQCLYDALVLSGGGGRTDAFVLVIVATSGGLRLFASGGYSTTTSLTLTAGAWNHVMVTRGPSSNNMLFYVNGTVDGGVVTMPTSITSGGAVLGRYADGAGGWLNGKIDDVALWNATRSATDASNLYAGTVTPQSLSSLVALWHYEEGSGTSAADSGGSGFTGTLTGSPTWDTDVPTPLT